MGAEPHTAFYTPQIERRRFLEYRHKVITGGTAPYTLGFICDHEPAITCRDHWGR
jgi:hypothetical protein